jgi:hypothetical protein
VAPLHFGIPSTHALHELVEAGQPPPEVLDPELALLPATQLPPLHTCMFVVQSRHWDPFEPHMVSLNPP